MSSTYDPDKIESLKQEISFLKKTLYNVNLFCDSLVQSNKILNIQVMELEQYVEMRMELISKFLAKHDLTVEDFMEFETELELENQMNGDYTE